MKEDFIRKRITQLRMQKNVSEYRMSMDLGHSKSYIQSISSGRALPSMPEFLAICDYFGIQPADFFDEGKSDLLLLQALQDETKDLPQEDLNLLVSIAKRLKK